MKAGGLRQQDEPDERHAHADRQRKWPGFAIGVEPHQGLQHRGGELEGEGDQAHLREGQVERLLEQRVDRRQERLDRVVEHVRKAQRQQNSKDGAFDGPGMFRQ